jgi:SAM-dependent methyltransferase
MRFADRELVKREYASEQRLLARRAVFTELVEGPNAEELAFEAVREHEPGRVLEVGCGPVYFAEPLRGRLGVEVVALDASPRLVELARERGLEALVGDVQELPFPEGKFDVVVANWMLYHVADLDLGLVEIARVLQPGGRLVAATFGNDHLFELWVWPDYRKAAAVEFSRDNGAERLRRHFDRVERRDASAVVVFPDREAVRRYVSATIRGSHLAGSLPSWEGESRARSSQAVFVAEKAS